MKRATWTGSIAFGLVNVPIKLYTSTNDSGPHVSLVTKNGVKVNSVRMANGRYIPWEETFRGAQVPGERGKYVVLDPDDLAKLRPERTTTIEIDKFSSAGEIDPYIITDYHIAGPDKGGARIYGLLRAALRESNVVGIGRVVLKSRERAVAVGVRGDAIIVATLAYADEIENPAPMLELDGAIPEPDAKTLREASKLVRAMTAKRFEHTAIEDTYRRDLVALIEKASKPKRSRKKKSEPTNELSAALEASIQKLEVTR